MISVLLVDDHALIRMGFRLVLDAEDDIEVVGEAADGTAAVSMCSALRPDVVLMDVRMPGHDGIAASLFLSEGTVKIHVGRILAKLGLRDRVQAVVLAYESRLITPRTPPPEEPGQPR